MGRRQSAVQAGKPVVLSDQPRHACRRGTFRQGACRFCTEDAVTDELTPWNMAVACFILGSS